MEENLTPEESDLAALVELKQFLEKEMGQSKVHPLKTLTPLTDGLGLESPPATSQREVRKAVVDKIFTEVEEPKPTLREKIAQALPDSPRVAEEATPCFEPPKLPAPTAAKRLLAWMLDQVFVLTIWSIALVFTSNIASGFATGFSTKVLEEFGRPQFLRLATLEFAILWLGYLTFCMAITQMTFGMWVWGLRVSFGDVQDDNHGMRKVMRIFWSFLFYAPVVPSFFLSFRSQGRNLLDVLSGTHLYQSTR